MTRFSQKSFFSIVIKNVFALLIFLFLIVNTALAVDEWGNLPGGVPGSVTEEQIRESQAEFQRQSAICRANTNRDGKTVWNGTRCVAPNTGICGPNGITVGNCLATFADVVVGYIFLLINTLLSLILTFTSWFLDIVVYMTVVKFRSNFSDLNLAGAGGIIDIAGSGSENLIYYLWGILRDLINIIILMTIIYSAVRVMFDGFKAHANKFIYLLLFSIVINFSLLLVKVAIDVSNILTLQAYTLSAKPVGFDTWENFRKRSADTQPSNIGESIMNNFSLYRLNSPEIQSRAATERIQQGMKISAVFQIGTFLIYLGVIYLLFLIIGILVLRALAFVFAMILAAFLAADLFLETVGFGSGSDKVGKEFLEGIQQISGKIKGDFFDGLIKGPILFLFIFFVGVLAHAIFTQGFVAELANITSGGNTQEFGTLSSGPFVSSLTIFFKFVLFFALAKFVIEKLKLMNFSKDGYMGGAAKKFASFGFRNTVGQLGRVPGFAGRTFARRLDRGGVLGRTFQRVNSGMNNWNNGNKWSLDANGNTVKNNGRLLFAARNIGRYGQAIGNAVRGGSYEVTQSRIGQKFKNTQVGQQIEKATGIFGPQMYKGKEIKGGFAERDKTYEKIRRDEIAKEQEIVKKGQVVSREEMDKIDKGVKFEIFDGSGDKARKHQINLSDYKSGVDSGLKVLEEKLTKKELTQAEKDKINEEIESRKKAFSRFQNTSLVPGTRDNVTKRDAMQDAYQKYLTSATGQGEAQARDYAVLDNSTLFGVAGDLIRGSRIESDVRLAEQRAYGRIVSKKHGVIENFAQVMGTSGNQHDEILDTYHVDKTIFNNYLSEGELDNLQTQSDFSELQKRIKQDLNDNTTSLGQAYEKLKTTSEDSIGLLSEQAEQILRDRMTLSILEAKMKHQMIEDKKKGRNKNSSVANYESQSEFRSLAEEEVKNITERFQGYQGDEELFRVLTSNKAILQQDLEGYKPRDFVKADERLRKINKIFGPLNSEDLEYKQKWEPILDKKARLDGLVAFLRDKNSVKTAAAQTTKDLGDYKKGYAEVFEGKKE